jgi:hypothetical protein
MIKKKKKPPTRIGIVSPNKNNGSIRVSGSLSITFGFE